MVDLSLSGLIKEWGNQNIDISLVNCNNQIEKQKREIREAIIVLKRALEPSKNRLENDFELF